MTFSHIPGAAGIWSKRRSILHSGKSEKGKWILLFGGHHYEMPDKEELRVEFERNLQMISI